MYQLKLCPFCGGRPYLEDHSRGFINGETTKVAFVRCTKCNARAERFNIADYGSSSWSKEAADAAVEAWNRRAESSEKSIAFTPQRERRAMEYRERRREEAVNGNVC